MDKDRFQKTQDPVAIQKQLIRRAERYLGQRAGEKYKDVVVKCLKGEFDVSNDTKEDLKLQQAFRAQVVEVLEKAASYV